MPRKARPLEVSSTQLSELQQLANNPTTEQRIARRARIVLHRVGGLSQTETARLVGVSRPVVTEWENRFRNQGIAGLSEKKRSGRTPSIPDSVRSEIISEATRPPANRTQWSTRSMAKAKNVSNQTVHKLWKANGIKPHLTTTFKVSNDPRFEEKFWDVIGLYLRPPDRGLVLCCDEKSQCQALERTQPGLPLGLDGHLKTKTHDYKRHGTVTLFAALSYLDGKIFHNTAPRHTHKEWLGFLKQIDKEAPGSLTLHLIIDNYSTHKHAKVKSWIKWRNQRHQKQEGVPRIQLHFTPTSSSWMNLVERFFRDITVDCIRSGSFGSVGELVAKITAYLEERNLDPRPYTWKADGQEILEKINRARETLGMGSICKDK